MAKRCSSGKLKGHPSIERMVGDVNVGLTDSEVLQHMRGRLRKGFWDRMPAPHRRWFDCEVLRVHHRNQDLYTAVVRGRL